MSCVKPTISIFLSAFVLINSTLPILFIELILRGDNGKEQGLSFMMVSMILTYILFKVLEILVGVLSLLQLNTQDNLALLKCFLILDIFIEGMVIFNWENKSTTYAYLMTLSINVLDFIILVLLFWNNVVISKPVDPFFYEIKSEIKDLTIKIDSRLPPITPLEYEIL